MGNAIITLVIGDDYAAKWKALSESGWRRYCERHGYDLVVIDKPLDQSVRAQSRSPAWQKCLILRPEISGSFERVVWVDADIAINPKAPGIIDNVPIEKVGAVDENSFPSLESRHRIIKEFVRSWRDVDPRVARNWQSFIDPADYHAFFGLPKRGTAIVQTGVLVLSPVNHRELLEHVYTHYEDRGGEPMNYEMRPLSFEIQERNLQHWIDQRFNTLISWLVFRRDVILRRPLVREGEYLSFIRAEFEKNYFLHFSGRRDLQDLAIAARI